MFPRHPNTHSGVPLTMVTGEAVLVAQGGGGWFRWVEEKGIPHPQCPPSLPLSLPGQATRRHWELSPAPNPLSEERDLWLGWQEVGGRGSKKKERYFLNYPRPMSLSGRVTLSLLRRAPFYANAYSYPDPRPISHLAPSPETGLQHPQGRKRCCKPKT